MGMHFAPPPPAAITSVLTRFDRAQLEGFIAIAIDLLDLADGDIDLELDGDELDGTGSAEEDTPLHAFGAGDGSPGDPDDAEDDDPSGGNPDDEGEAGNWAEPGTGGGLRPYDDGEDEEDGWREIRRAQRNRIRLRRCLAIHSPDPRHRWTEYQLREDQPTIAFGRPA